MGLAGVFGDQAYVCKNCGHSMTMYAPHCPKCLNKNLTRIENQKRPGPSGQLNEEVRETVKPRSPLIPYAVVAIILAVFVAAYNMFAPPRPESAQSNAATSTPKPDVNASSARAHDRTVRHVNHANTHATVQPARVHTTATSASATPRAPMKLWKVSPDADGGDQ